jgi:hypothetical protein
MLRTCGYLLSLLMLCGIASEAGAATPSALSGESGSAATITQVAHHNKRKMKRHKAARPRRPKGQHAPRNKHQQ